MHERTVATATHGKVLSLEAAVPRPVVFFASNEGVAPVPFVVGRVAPRTGSLAVHEGRQREPVALCWNVDSHRLAEGRHDVDIFGEVVDHTDVVAAWIADDSHDRITRFVEAGLLDQTLVAQLLGVIGGDDDDGALPFVPLLERRPDASELSIDLADHAEVLGLDISDVAAAGGRRGRAAQQSLEQAVPIGDARHRKRCRARRRVVHRAEIARRAVWRVGP